MPAQTLENLKRTTVRKLLEIDISPREAELEANDLIKHIFALDRKDLLLRPNTELDENKLQKFDTLIERRINEGVPVQYLTNTAYFMDGEFYVDENVLIPRPETEILVEQVLKQITTSDALRPPRNDSFEGNIIDIGTGSGCIAIMLAKNLPQAQIIAVDVSEKALDVAKRNAENLGVAERIRFVHSNIFEAREHAPLFQSEKFDVIVSNPPYIPAKDKSTLQREVAQHEPALALFVDDEEGVSFYRELSLQAKEHLNPGGLLAVEVGFSQAELVEKLFANAGLVDICTVNDLSGIARVVMGKKS